MPILVLVGLSALLAVFLVKSDRGAKEPLLGLIEAFGFGVLAIGIALGIEKLVIPANLIGSLYSGRVHLGSVALFSLAIGFIEEAAKFIPLAIFIHRKKYFNEHNDGLIYFGLAGLGFGLIENLYYLFQFGTQIGLLRAVILLFFHPAAAAIVGYFFVRHHLNKKPLWQTGAALVGVSLLHALYNFGLGSRSGLFITLSLMTTAAMNLSLFLFYRRATELDQSEGLAAEGDNKFCRHCGKPNPAHFLYCEHCGNQA